MSLRASETELDTRPGQVYRREIRLALPRLLAMFDSDPLSPTYGLGDRGYWAWKAVDFANASYQCAVHGLARLVATGQLPKGLAEAAVLRRIRAMLVAVEGLRARNGSVAEILPHENSFCVTALLAFDLLTARELLGQRLSNDEQARCSEVVAPMIGFLRRTDERHGMISNHLATAAAALLRWAEIAGGEGETRARELLDRILREQSEEGWLREYGGADPGYQSLATYYLADAHLRRPDLGLEAPLRRSLAFLEHFALPDGSFGGLYGSRNTRFICPAGFEALASQMPEAARLARFARWTIAAQRAVTLSALDPPNLVQFFNAYAWAAAAPASLTETGALPAQRGGCWRQRFDDAGLLIDKSVTHYTVISWHKGGIVYHVVGDSEVWIDAGVAARDRRGRLFTSQALRTDNFACLDGDSFTVEAPLVAAKHELPSPLKFVLLRLLCLTAFRSKLLADLVKRLLVRRLITGQRRSQARNRRTIRLGAALTVDDHLESASELKRLATDLPFHDIHMASQGYWQTQDDLL